MMNIGIIGLGYMAATHLQAMHKVTPICNPSGRHLDGNFDEVFAGAGSDDKLQLDMSQVKTYRDYDEMLADSDLQIVDVCSPTLVHPDHAIKALEAGKHVLLEKPVARTSEPPGASNHLVCDGEVV